jgi:hypothetical protein
MEQGPCKIYGIIKKLTYLAMELISIIIIITFEKCFNGKSCQGGKKKCHHTTTVCQVGLCL